MEAIAEEFLDQTVHSKETVYKYYITFMRRYKEIKDYGRIWEKCDRALEKAIKEKRTKVAMEWFYEGITEVSERSKEVYSSSQNKLTLPNNHHNHHLSKTSGSVNCP